MLIANEEFNRQLSGDEQAPNAGRVSVSKSWGENGQDQDHNIRQQEFISQRRRCFLFISVFPFFLSAIALFTMLAFNSNSMNKTSVVDSAAVSSLRGNSNGKDEDPHVETAFLAEVALNETSITDNASISPTVYTHTTTVKTPSEDTLDSLSTTTSTKEATSSPSQTQPATTASITSLATSVELVTTATQPDSTTVTGIFTCEEATTHEQCINHSSNCVWFSPLNWDDLCFTKPHEFSLKECKEVRLEDDCLQSAVGCTWSAEKGPAVKRMQKAKGPGDKRPVKEVQDICRFSRQGDLRGKAPKT
jgi:hypothetical protein